MFGLQDKKTRNFLEVIFGIKITMKCLQKSIVFKSLTKRFEQIPSTFYQDFSHNKNQNMQFFFTFKKFCKITKN